MASVLKNVVRFTALVVGVPQTQPHLLNINKAGVLPHFVVPRTGGYTVTYDATTVTVTRGANAADAVDVYLERWHTMLGANASLPPFTFQPTVPVPVDEWASAAVMPSAKVNFAWDLLTAGSIFVAGGEDGYFGTPLATSALFDLATNAWAVKAAIPNLANHQDPNDTVGITLPDGTFFFFPVIENVTSFAEIYTPGSNSWADTTGAIGNRLNQAIYGGLHPMFLIAGGPFVGDLLLQEGGGLGDSIVYDVAAETFGNTSHTIGQDFTYQCAHTMTTDGHVFLANIPAGGGAHSLQEWDPATNVWTDRAGLPYPVRSGSRLIELTSGPEVGNLLFVGGANADDNGPPFAAGLATTLIYRRGSNTWVAGPAMAVGRYHPVLERLADGRILCAGGDPASGSVEFFDETALAWTPGPDMPWNGQAMAASLITNWNGSPALLAVFGGIDGGAATDKVAIFREQP